MVTYEHCTRCLGALSGAADMLSVLTDEVDLENRSGQPVRFLRDQVVLFTALCRNSRPFEDWEQGLARQLTEQILQTLRGMVPGIERDDLERGNGDGMD